MNRNVYLAFEDGSLYFSKYSEKLSLYWPGQAFRAPGVEASRILDSG
jgi:hypothetical protein